MTTTRFDVKARPLAKQIGLDQLGQAKLKQLDKNGDGVVTITDVRRIAKQAGLEKDQSLSKDDRKRIDLALGGKAPASTTGTTGPSSAVATMTGTGKKSLVDMYIDTDVKQTKAGLSLKINGEKSQSLVLKNIDSSAVDLLFYGVKGKTGMSNSSSAGGTGISMTSYAAGMIVAAADKERGIVLVDVAAKDFLDGKQPPQRRILSNSDIAKSAAVKGAAKKAGLDTKELTVKVKEIFLSAAFEDSKVNTLGFEAQVTDKNGKSTTQRFSTYLGGDLSKSAEKLTLDKLEAGMLNSWGYLLPPSAKPKADTPTHVNNGGGYSGGGGTGGGEYVAPVHHHHGGGSESSTVVYSGGGGGGE